MAQQFKLRRLLPLTPNSLNPPFDPSPLPKRKRPQVSAACNGCRKRKVKCDGVRPNCCSCSYAKIPCVYPVPEGLSQREAQKQKLSDMSTAHEKSHRVLQLLRGDQDGFSHDILQQLRQSEHLDDAIQAIADASLLLPHGDEPAQFSQASQGGVAREPRGRPPAGNHKAFPRIRPAENADPDTTILPVSHWTTISHDDKLLSRLFGLFWVWDNTLSLLADRELLIAELSSRRPLPGEQHHFCSPLLVNAILAVSTLHSTREYSSPTDEVMGLAQRFADCAFDIIEGEKNLGSLTLIQSAAILWVYARNNGSQTSQARVTRLAESMRGIWPVLFDSLEEQTAHDPRLRRAISQIAWGFYCFFAKMALTWSPQMLVPKPHIMKTFEVQDGLIPGSQTSASSSSAVKDPIVAQEACKLQLFTAECSLCEIIDEFVSCFVSGAPQRAVLDSVSCTALYNKLLCWKLSLPENITTRDSALPSALLLQTTYDFVALKLLSTFTRQCCTKFDGRNAESLQVFHASSLVTSLSIYRNIYTLRTECWAAEHCAYAVRVLLAHLEAEPAVHDVVARGCCVLHEMGNPGAVSGRAAELLGEIEEMARGTGVRIPAYGRGSRSSEIDATPGFVVEGARVLDGSAGGMPGNACSVSFGGSIRDVQQGLNGGAKGLMVRNDG